MCGLGLQATPQSLGLSVQSRFTPAPSWQQDQLVSGTQLAPRFVRGRDCLWGFLKQPPMVPMAFHEGNSFHAHRSPPLLAFFWYLS